MTTPAKLDSVTLYLLENRFFHGKTEEVIFLTNQLIVQKYRLADNYGDDVFFEILGWTQDQINQIKTAYIQLTKSPFLKETPEFLASIPENNPGYWERYRDQGIGPEADEKANAEAEIPEPNSQLNLDHAKSWLTSKWNTAKETASKQAGKIADQAKEMAQHQALQFAKKHATTITVGLLCRKYGINPIIAQEIVDLIKKR